MKALEIWGKGNIKMAIKRIFVVIAAVTLTSAVFADNSSVTSKKYVDDFMTGYQDKLSGSGADKLMIYVLKSGKASFVRNKEGERFNYEFLDDESKGVIDIIVEHNKKYL